MIKDYIEVIECKRKGRSVIAKLSISAGQNLIRESPLVCIPFEHSTLSGLSVKEGKFRYSHIENELKSATMGSNFNGSLCMLAARYYVNSLNILNKDKDKCTDGPGYLSVSQHRIRNHVDLAILNNDTSMIESVRECAKIMLQLISHSVGNMNNIQDVSLDQCIDIIYTISCNVFTIVNDFFNDCGLGIYPFAAMINHSCAPNCCQQFDEEGAIIIRTIKDINAGEEITISYIDTAKPTWLRRRELLKSYYFYCDCNRCISGNNDINGCLNEGYKCHACILNKTNGSCHIISNELHSSTYKAWISGEMKTDYTLSMNSFSELLPYDLPLPYFNILYTQIINAQNNNCYLQVTLPRFHCNTCERIYDSSEIVDRIKKSLNNIDIAMKNINKKAADQTYLVREIIRYHSIYDSLRDLIPSESCCMLHIRKRLKLAFETSLPVNNGVLLFNCCSSTVSNKYFKFNSGETIQSLYETNLRELRNAMLACYPGPLHICSLFSTIQLVWYLSAKYNLYTETQLQPSVISDWEADFQALFHLLPSLLEQVAIIYGKTHPFYYSMSDVQAILRALY